MSGGRGGVGQIARGGEGLSQCAPRTQLSGLFRRRTTGNRGSVKSNLVVRVLTSVVALPLLFLLLFFGTSSVWLGFVALVVAVTSLEFFRMTSPGDRLLQIWGALTTLLMFGLIVVVRSHPIVTLAGLLLLPIVATIVPLLRVREVEGSGLSLLAALAVPSYLGALSSPLYLLRLEQGPAFIVLVLGIAWFGDTGAYFAGRTFGKKKLYPRISPNKTWAGFYGAVLSAGVFSTVFSLFVARFPLIHALGLGLLTGALGQLGDLVESWLKRVTGVKDSGALIPGHGGLFDRIDALLFVCPVVYVYTLLVGR